MAGARTLEEQVLGVRRRVLGDEHPSTLTVMANLAGSLRAQGEVAGARTLDEKVLAVRRRVLGDEHPDTLRAMGNLAASLLAQGEVAEALWGPVKSCDRVGWEYTSLDKLYAEARRNAIWARPVGSSIVAGGM